MSDPLIQQLRSADRRLSMTEVIEKPLSVGTAFPTGIAAGFLFFRTDLGFLCFYDGTRWLTVHEYSVNWTYSAPAAGTYIMAVLRQDYAPYITRRATAVLTGITNTGANYWTITILGANATQSATTTIDVANTSAQGASVWASGSAAPSSTSTPANAAAIDVQVAATGAPTVLPTLAITVYYRLIVT